MHRGIAGEVGVQQWEWGGGYLQRSKAGGSSEVDGL